MPSEPRPLHVSLVAVPEAAMSTLIGIYDVLNAFGLLAKTDPAIPETPPFAVDIVSTEPGEIALASGLPLRVGRAVAQVDATDIVLVPSVVLGPNGWEKGRYPEIVDFAARMHKQGALLCSACSGIFLLAETGLFDGHRATSHYSNEGFRAKRFPKVLWQKNIRYVADGKVASSAGVSASMPTSIALVEAIAGAAKAAEVARDVGIDDWSSRHDSDAFQSDPGNADMPARDARPDVTLGIPVKAGDDEIALAVTAEAYSRTGNTFGNAVGPSKAPVRLAHGLVVLPDMVAGTAKVSRMLAPLEAHQATRALDIALADITKTYGPKAARNVALFMEYPGKID